ncbi:unnamed protein product [Didymodactylos carnosus]|uniref:Integral membrane bound transporter domain-containing protein n=2 Tax=Didymodactylos carnosus TaxID=1234261 RepID=A0A8S2DH93_9BILA|nr:unnamed protein product [Didymodactylos carnosus]CAF3676802.1 unnamed protein product [Didymodactylos carnosus]
MLLMSAVKSTFIVGIGSIFVLVPRLAAAFENGQWILIALCMTQTECEVALTVGGAFTAMKLRILGTLLGAMYGYVTYISVHDNVSYTFAMFVPWILICGYLKQMPSWSYAGSVAAITPIVINLGRLPYGDALPAGNYALLRIEENFVGISIGIFLTMLIFPVFALDTLKENIMKTLLECKDAVGTMHLVYDQLLLHSHEKVDGEVNEEHDDKKKTVIDKVTKIDLEKGQFLNRQRTKFQQLISVQRNLVVQVCFIDIQVSPNPSCNIKFYEIIGDCPALKLILNFIGHTGYYCCSLCYIHGIQSMNKRQYLYLQPLILRGTTSYLEESRKADRINRKMRAVKDLSYIKVTEFRNMLLYGLLPKIYLFLSLETIAYFALYVCSIRLLYGKRVFWTKTSMMPDQLLGRYYEVHEHYYTGLQNLILHLYLHYSPQYDHHGACCNIGTSGQEDLIGHITSNCHVTRYYGELIAYYYSIDFSLHNKTERKIPPNRLTDETNQNDGYAIVKYYPTKHLYSVFFESSKYYGLLRDSLDILCFVLNQKPSTDCICPNFIYI